MKKTVLKHNAKGIIMHAWECFYKNGKLLYKNEESTITGFAPKNIIKNCDALREEEHRIDLLMSVGMWVQVSRSESRIHP